MGMNDTLEFEEGSSFVYGDFLLARTQYYLPKVIRMPEDISVLVQKVYGFTLEEKDGRVLMDNDIQFSDSLSEKYLEFLENYRSKIKMKEKKANDYRIEDPVLEETIAHEENLSTLGVPGPSKRVLEVRQTHGVLHEKADTGLASLDSRNIHQGPQQPLPEGASSHRGSAPVQTGEQRDGPLKIGRAHV